MMHVLTNQSATVAFRWQMGRAHLVCSAETFSSRAPWYYYPESLLCSHCLTLLRWQIGVAGFGGALGLLLFTCVGSALRDHPSLTTAEECIYSSDFTPEAPSKEHPNQLSDVPDTNMF